MLKPDRHDCKTLSGRLILAVIFLFLLTTGSACRLISPAANTVEPGLTETSPTLTLTPIIKVITAPASSAAPSPTADFSAAFTPTQTLLPDDAGALAFACEFSPVTAQILARTSADQWIDWIASLSGAQPVTIGGEETLISTRYSPAMFDGNPKARAMEYVMEQVHSWYPPEQITLHDYEVENTDGETFTWQNLVLTLPGSTRPDEIVILSAHLDSISEDPENNAPGAEDNGSGSAALLEAARIFRDYPFERTLQIIWFTGEEQGLLGSSAYVSDLGDKVNQITGVINLDMFGYDSDGDRCFELHVGELPESDLVGQCFVSAIPAYDLDLPVHDYIIEDAIERSDHGSFWEAGVGAIEVLQNLFENDLPGGCTNGDRSPYYHSTEDTVDKINPETGIAIVRAALAAAAGLAVPLQ
jgi:hypothetical protein